MIESEALAASQSFNAKARQAGWASLCDASLAFVRPEFAELLELWRGHADSDGLPYRRDFGPRNLKALLRHVAIYEKVEDAPARYRVRLMGTAFADAMGDLSGKFVDEAVAPEFLPRWYAALGAALEAKAPLRFVSRLDTVNKSYLVAEYFEAPVLADDGSVSLILAAGHFAPRPWSEVSAHEARRLAAQAEDTTQ
jgi:hypothetical protein